MQEGCWQRCLDIACRPSHVVSNRCDDACGVRAVPIGVVDIAVPGGSHRRAGSIHLLQDDDTEAHTDGSFNTTRGLAAWPPVAACLREKAYDGSKPPPTHAAPALQAPDSTLPESAPPGPDGRCEPRCQCGTPAEGGGCNVHACRHHALPQQAGPAGMSLLLSAQHSAGLPGHNFPAAAAASSLTLTALLPLLLFQASSLPIRRWCH